MEICTNDFRLFIFFPGKTKTSAMWQNIVFAFINRSVDYQHKIKTKTNTGRFQNRKYTLNVEEAKRPVLCCLIQLLPNTTFNTTMRQLKGKVSKENGKMKRDRKKAFKEGQNQALTVALPILLGIVVVIIGFVLMKTSSKAKQGIQSKFSLNFQWNNTHLAIRHSLQTAPYYCYYYYIFVVYSCSQLTFYKNEIKLFKSNFFLTTKHCNFDTL